MMRPISKGKQGGAVSAILVPDELNSMAMYERVSDDLGFRSAWVPLNNEDKVMLTLLRRKKLHLHQAWDTHAHMGRYNNI
eukprot:6751471-Ditylum_brightwellii.AAC.1